MRNAWGRLMAWLRREAYVRAVVEATAKQAYLDGHKEGHEAGARNGYRTGYEIGLGQGEINGRMALANELQTAHGVDVGGEKPMTKEQLENLTRKQLH